MVWSNKATRAKFTVEKSHSLSFAVRVEDRLHRNIIEDTDTAFFTVRPASYLVGFDDTDLTNGTSAIEGNGIRVDAKHNGEDELRVPSPFGVARAAANDELEVGGADGNGAEVD